MSDFLRLRLAHLACATSNPRYLNLLSCKKLTSTTTGVRLYNDQEFFVSCDINVPVSSKIRARAPVARETENLAVLPGILDKMMKGGDPTPAFDGNLTQPAGGVDTGDVDMLDKRQGACGIWSQTTRRVGDGNPHQNYFLKQLSVFNHPLLTP